MQSANDIRRTFLEYFGKNGHKIVDSSPLVPLNDPTLMFTNAGMVQFKNVFTGLEQRDYVRATTSQKCVRAGGKHNDLENVGFTARHHTFFEMLGNFSFGDYFKETAIELAWKLVTKEFGLNQDKLLVTVYSEDDEAYNLWKKIAGFSDSKIIRIPTTDNFWSMGDTGPCGPCSEIFYDHGDHIWGGPPGSPEEDGDRFIEIWNLVFMQYEQLASGDRVGLPKPSIDTGMGLERIAAVMQGTHDNYEIDLLRRLIEASADVTNTDPDGDFKTSHRVIADHIRSSSFLMADGVLPSNEGRGYVLRRIMRRAMRHAHMIGTKDATLFKLVSTLVSKMGQAFPELVRAEALITETLELEEKRFKKLLDRGLNLLDAETGTLGEGDQLSGEVAFKLYDTYGFPIDLTQDALKPRKIGVDMDGFAAAMERQRAEARAAWSGSGDAATEQIWFEVREELGASEFLGYETESAEGQIVAIIKDGARVQSAAAGDEVAILLNQTPFYGESGGQVGDSGVIKSDRNSFTVRDTAKKVGALHVHNGVVASGAMKVGDDVKAIVDHQNRSQIRANHSVTHLIHSALRQKLGEHVTQKGSMVSADRLRFDISHPKAISLSELEEVEAAVNSQIRLNSPVVTRLMTPEEAIEAGAMALFGEKYGDEVRVVSMGEGAKGSFSTELCGGTHVRRTGDIGLLKVVSEGAVAAGVRRLEALTGAAAQAYLVEQEQTLFKAAELLKAKPQDVPARISALVEDRRKLEREIADLRKKLASGGAASGSDVKEINGIKFLGRVMENIPGRDLKPLVDEMKSQVGSGVCVVISVNDGKASIVVGVTDDLSASKSAVDLVRVGAEALGGKGGGGRPDMAQAGGPDGDKAEAAIAALEAALAN